MKKTKNNYVPAEYGGYLFPKSCLPDILPGDRGKVLTVNETETAAEWEQASGGGGVMKVNLSYDSGTRTYTVDKTWNEMHSAAAAGVFVYIWSSGNIWYPTGIYSDGPSAYVLVILTNDGNFKKSLFLLADSENGYPSYID